MLQGDGPFGPVVNGTMVVFYQYRPNQVAGYTFMALFSLATLGHIVYIVRLKTWIFIPFILGGIGEQHLIGVNVQACNIALTTFS